LDVQGHEARRQYNVKILSGEVSYRDAFKAELESVKLPFEECKEFLKKSAL
jgi:2-hydroxy-3-keto-5-methylthiopentenyl-1-phosphate phosphatase